MQLVVQKLSLLVGPLDRGELPPADRISRRYARSFVQDISCSCRNGDPGLDHDLIDDLWICFHLEITRLCDIHEA